MPDSQKRLFEILFCIGKEIVFRHKKTVVDDGLSGLAGAAGLEPANDGVKVRCLTAWLRPNRVDMNN